VCEGREVGGGEVWMGWNVGLDNVYWICVENHFVVGYCFELSQLMFTLLFSFSFC